MISPNSFCTIATLARASKVFLKNYSTITVNLNIFKDSEVLRYGYSAIHILVHKKLQSQNVSRRLNDLAFQNRADMESHVVLRKSFQKYAC